MRVEDIIKQNSTEDEGVYILTKKGFENVVALIEKDYVPRRKSRQRPVEVRTRLQYQIKTPQT